MKIVDPFHDGHGNYDNNLLFFKIKFLQKRIFFLLQLVRVMIVPKKYKMVVKNEIPNLKISNLVRFSNEILVTSQISNQVFHNMSDFKSEILQRVGLCFKKTF